MNNQAELQHDPSKSLAREMLTVRETACRLAISLSSTYGLIQGGKLPHYRIGGAIRIAASDIETFLAGCRQEQPDQVVRTLKPRLRHIKLPP